MELAGRVRPTALIHRFRALLRAAGPKLSIRVLSGVSVLLYVMARINWELEPGEKIGEFVAALLLLRHEGPGNRITPSRGDRGVDIRLADPDGIRFYQVKRYPLPLTSSQKTQTAKSWTTFLAETAHNAPVKSWMLACPWNPTNEALEWLHDLTADAGFPTDWMGQATLEVSHAEELGGNAVLGARFDSSDIGNGLAEIVAYGTAARVHPVPVAPQEKPRTLRPSFCRWYCAGRRRSVASPSAA